jgi:hemerythrin
MDKRTQSPPDWDDGVAFGDPAIDVEHDHLRDLLGRLHELETGRPDRQATHQIFNDLMEFAITHFKTEERFMRRAGYPLAFEHALAHERVLSRLIELSGMLMERDLRLFSDSCRELRVLANEHHNNDDRACNDWLNSSGPGRP